MGADITIKQKYTVPPGNNEFENTLEFNKHESGRTVYMHPRKISHHPTYLPKPPGMEANESHYHGDIDIPSEVVDKNGKKYKVIALGEPEKPVMYQAGKVTRVKIPGTVKKIYPESFCGSLHLDDVWLREGTKIIQQRAFAYCNLFHLYLPDSIETIYYSFECNPNLEHVEIGSGMTMMKGAFKACPAIRTVVCKAITPPYITEDTFDESVLYNARLTVPYQSLKDYKNSKLWGKFRHIDEIADTVPQDEVLYRATHREVDGIIYEIDLTGTSAKVVPPKQIPNDFRTVYKKPKVVIAEKIDNDRFTVREIGEKSFDGSKLSIITLPSGINTIGKAAFRESPLIDIVLPDACSTISESAFEACTELKSFQAPNAYRIGKRAFARTSKLQSIRLSSMLHTIESEAFAGSALKEIRLEHFTTVPQIQEDTFDANILKNAVLTVDTSNLDAIKADPIWGKFLHIVSEGSSANSNLGDTFVFDYIRYKVTSSYPKEVTVIKVVENYKDMLEHRAHDCGVVNIMIPNKVEYNGEEYTVTDISDEASGEESINIGVLEIPRGVKRIGKKAFYYSVNMKGLILHDGLKVIEESAFEDSTRTYATISPFGIKLPNTLLEIGSKAFSQCGGISGELKIPDSVISIGSEAFSGCWAITGELKIPDSVTSIGRNAFEGTGITSVTFGKGIERIESGTFSDSNLKELFIPDWIKYIGSSAFAIYEEDKKGILKKVTCMATPPPAIDPSAFDEEAYRNAELFVPSSALQAYKDDVAWQQFAKITGIDDGLTPPPLKPVCTGDYINVNGLRYYVRDAEHRVVYVTKLDNGFIYRKEQIVIPATIEYHGVTYWVKKVDKEAFKDAKGLSRITLPYTIDEIMEDAFTGCSFASVTCYAATPPLVAKDAILPDKDKRKYAILSVPKTSVELYEADKNWKGYDHITAENFTAPPAPEGLPEPPHLLDPGNNFVVYGLRYWYKGDDVVYFADAPKEYSYAGKMLVPLTVEYHGVTYRVTKVGNYAFKNATNVTKVCLNSEIEEIKTEAFVGCTGLTKLVCFAKKPPVLAKDAIPKEVAQHLEIMVDSAYRGEYLMAGWGNLGAKLTFDSPQKLLDEWNN